MVAMKYISMCREAMGGCCSCFAGLAGPPPRSAAHVGTAPDPAWNAVVFDSGALFEPTVAPASPKTFDGILGEFDADAKVGLVTMLGTLCPVTRAHIEAFVQAEKLLQGRTHCGQKFDAVVAVALLNPDSYVKWKLKDTQGLPWLTVQQRADLIQKATVDLPWLTFKPGNNAEAVAGDLRSRFPNLVHYTMNGADDVISNKLNSSSWRNSPQIIMQRPGKEELMGKLAAAGIREDDENKLLGPMLEDVSSTAVRNALKAGDRTVLDEMLHPDVTKWLQEDGRYCL